MGKYGPEKTPHLDTCHTEKIPMLIIHNSFVVELFLFFSLSFFNKFRRISLQQHSDIVLRSSKILLHHELQAGQCQKPLADLYTFP